MGKCWALDVIQTLGKIEHLWVTRMSNFWVWKPDKYSNINKNGT